MVRLPSLIYISISIHALYTKKFPALTCTESLSILTHKSFHLWLGLSHTPISYFLFVWWLFLVVLDRGLMMATESRVSENGFWFVFVYLSLMMNPEGNYYWRAIKPQLSICSHFVSESIMLQTHSTQPSMCWCCIELKKKSIWIVN